MANTKLSSISTHRRTETLRTVNAKEIQNYQKDALIELQGRLGLGEVWGVIEIPVSWLPPGICSANGTRVLDMRLASQSDSISDEAGELGILTLTRYALLCFLVPIMGPRVGAVLLAPTSISACIKYMRVFVKLALQRPEVSTGGVLSRLNADDLCSIGLRVKHFTELNRMLQFKSRGYWRDSPNIDAPGALKREIQALQNRTGDDEDAVDVGKARPGPFLPFSDEFVGESGWRMAWIVEQLGPVLIPCAEGLAAIYKNLKSGSKRLHALESKRSRTASIFLSSYSWIDAKGNVLTDLPFQISFNGNEKGTGFCWPPKTHIELKCLLVLLQTAHLHIALLSTGGRISEILSFQEGGVVEASDGTVTIAGRTYKLVTVRGGEKRDWPLPALGVLSIYQQERLANICDAINLNGGIDEPEDEVVIPADDDELGLDQSITSSIWRRVGTGKRILGDYNNMLISAIDVLGLTDLSDGVNPHAHRFRKTVGRLLALALADAPKILMDLFGHKTIEMTLHYMLTDPLVRAEMQEVLKAQTIMLAVDAIEQIDDYGGPSAVKIKEAVDSLKVRLGREFGAKDIKDLAEIFTLSGKFWTLVRPGVICTKLPQQAGPCNKQVGMPEPSRCRSHCDFRLEQAALRDDVDRSIEKAFQFLEEAIQEENEISVEMWLGQVYANLNRFPGLQQKWEVKLAEFQHLQSCPPKS